MIELFIEHGQLFKVEKNNHIFQEGERAEDIFFIKEGAIQISQQTESGRELTIRICGKGVIIGENAMFCHINYHSTTAKATENSNDYITGRKTCAIRSVNERNTKLNKS